jgi:hypothetical protein
MKLEGRDIVKDMQHKHSRGAALAHVARREAAIVAEVEGLEAMIAVLAGALGQEEATRILVKCEKIVALVEGRSVEHLVPGDGDWGADGDGGEAESRPDAGERQDL